MIPQTSYLELTIRACGFRSITPVVTVVQSASDGFEKGDLAGVLDADLANRLDEFMHISKNCQAGWEFDKEHPSNRRASGTYG